MGIFDKYKSWLSLEEATDKIAEHFQGKAKPADILRLGLDGHLTLSINIFNEFKAYSIFKFSGKEPVTSLNKTAIPQGVYDLDMTEGGLIAINDYYLHLAESRTQWKGSLAPFIVRGNDFTYYKTSHYFSLTGIETIPCARKTDTGWETVGDKTVPINAKIVIRTDELQRFFNSPKDKTPEEFINDERMNETHRDIIAAMLADDYGLQGLMIARMLDISPDNGDPKARAANARKIISRGRKKLEKQVK